MGKGCPERLTVDFGLVFVGPEGAEAWAPPDTLVVEVKSQNVRGIGDGVLRSSGARGSTCSKYCIGLNLVRPDMRYSVFSSSSGPTSPGRRSPAAHRSGDRATSNRDLHHVARESISGTRSRHPSE